MPWISQELRFAPKFYTVIWKKKKGNKLSLCATYAASPPFVFLQRLLFSEIPLNEKLTVELLLSLGLGKRPRQLLYLGKKANCEKIQGQAMNKGRMQTLAQGLKKKGHWKDPFLLCWPLDLNRRSKDTELMYIQKVCTKSFLPTRNTPPPVSLVCNYPRAEVSPDYRKTVTQLCYHLPVVIRTSLCISHLIKINKNEQAATKRMGGTRTPRCNVKPAGAIALGVTPPLESPHFTRN